MVSDNQCFPYSTYIIFFNKFISVSLKWLVNKREMIIFLGNHRKIFKMAVTWAWIISSLVLMICGFTIAGMCIRVCLRLMKIVIFSIFQLYRDYKIYIYIYILERKPPSSCMCSETLEFFNKTYFYLHNIKAKWDRAQVITTLCKACSTQFTTCIKIIWKNLLMLVEAMCVFEV